jgi:hypothetical protein
MLTIFGLPKAFEGQFKLIQENAVRSWARLSPRPEIILFGDDTGTREMATEIGARHEPEVVRNEWGTPLIGNIFARAQENSSNQVMCYLNSDIIVMSSLITATRTLLETYPDRPFLGVARKSKLVMTEAIDFAPGWEEGLAARAKEVGDYPTYDSDLFVFRRGLWRDVPDFAIGRCYWTQWLMYKARTANVDMIDLTAEVVNIESDHDYSHARSTGHSRRLSGVEYETNRKLFRGCKYYTTVNSTRVLTEHGLIAPPAKNRVLGYTVRLEYFIYFLLKGTWYPYSLPLILIGRYVAAAIRLFKSLPRRLTEHNPA